MCLIEFLQDNIKRLYGAITIYDNSVLVLV